MLQTPSALLPPGQGNPPSERRAPSLIELLGVLRRQFAVVIVTLALCVGAAGLYLATAQKMFNASASLLIDIHQDDPLQKRPNLDSQSEITSIESHVQLLTSDAIALAVVRRLNLAQDPEFTEPDGSLPSRLIEAVRGLLASPSPELTLEERERLAGERLVSRLTPFRVGRTYVVNIGFTSPDPAKASLVANAVANAYTTDQLSARYGAADRAATWLRDRLSDLRKQVLDADRAVEEFKAKNNIVSTSRGLVNEQQLSELSSQLVLARVQSADRKARFESVLTLGTDGIPDAVVAESLQNTVIVRLRQQYLDAARREADLTARYGADHPAVANLRAEMAEARRAIKDELARIAATYESDFRIAKGREEELDRNLAGLVDQTSRTNQERIELRSLETSAQTFRAIFESFLQQHTVTLQQQSFPISYARVITPAKPPTRKSHPRTSIVLLGSLVAGFGLGWLAGFARENLDATIRSEHQVESATGLRAIGLLPEIEPAAANLGAPVGAGRDGFPLPAVGGGLPMLRYARLDPFSRFANTVQNVRVTLDLAGDAPQLQVIGVISAQAGEGKTTLAANLGHHLAKVGCRTVLLDWHLRHPTLSRATTRRGDLGLIEVSLGETRLEDVLVVDHESGLAFVPLNVARRVPNTAEVLTSAPVRALVESLRTRYDYIIVDLPALDSVIDARAVSNVVDGFVLVCELGRTSVDAIARAVHRWDAACSAPIIGFVLNRLRVRQPRRLPALARGRRQRVSEAA